MSRDVGRRRNLTLTPFAGLSVNTDLAEEAREVHYLKR